MKTENRQTLVRGSQVLQLNSVHQCSCVCVFSHQSRVFVTAHNGPAVPDVGLSAEEASKIPAARDRR